jgi:hypothetical protein
MMAGLRYQGQKEGGIVTREQLCRVRMVLSSTGVLLAEFEG